MELDDLKSAWDNTTKHNDPKQNLTPETIIKMTQKKYSSKINKVAYPEIIGMVICLSSVVFIGTNFYKLDTNLLQGVGFASILLLLLLSIISLLSFRQLNFKKDFNMAYGETLKIFATQKLQFYKLQKINITLSYLLLVVMIVLFSKLFNGNDISSSKYFWTFSFCFGYIFLLFYSKWVSKYYNKVIKQAEELLQELRP